MKAEEREQIRLPAREEEPETRGARLLAHRLRQRAIAAAMLCGVSDGTTVSWVVRE